MSRSAANRLRYVPSLNGSNSTRAEPQNPPTILTTPEVLYGEPRRFGVTLNANY
jgi:hypothetical protein